MKKLLITASLFSLVGATAAFAQPTPQERQEHRQVEREVARDHQATNREIARDRQVTNREIARDRAVVNQDIRRDRAVENRQLARDRAVVNRDAARFYYRGRSYNRFHGPAYSYPTGFGYRSWARGQYLPHAYLASPYYITDWRTYAWAPPPPGFIYVRVGPDVLLVNIRTGFISETIPAVFF